METAAAAAWEKEHRAGRNTTKSCHFCCLQIQNIFAKSFSRHGLVTRDLQRPDDETNKEIITRTTKD